MIRSVFVAIALAIGVAPEPGAPPTRPPATPIPNSALAVSFEETGSGSKLARVDPLTLKQAGRSVDLASGGGWTTAFSPDGQTLALSGGMGLASVELVDVRRMRSLGVVELHMSGTVTLLSWERGILFAVVGDHQSSAVVGIDPTSRDAWVRHRVRGTILHAKSGIGGQVVLLLAPKDRIGPLRLAVVGGKGMTTASVPGFVGGWTTERDGDAIATRQHVPALVVDEAGKRALVVAGRAVAEVSLRNLAVTQHTLAEPVSLLERFRNWVEPSAHAKLVEGASWNADWVGGGVFALSGMHYALGEGKPAGLALVDTRDWSIRTVDGDAVDLVATKDALLTWNFDARDGVHGYDLDGAERFHLLRSARVFWLQETGGLVYAHLGNGKRVAVIDPARGRVLAVASTDRPLSLVED